MSKKETWADTPRITMAQRAARFTPNGKHAADEPIPDQQLSKARNTVDLFTMDHQKSGTFVLDEADGKPGTGDITVLNRAETPIATIQVHQSKVQISVLDADGNIPLLSKDVSLPKPLSKEAMLGNELNKDLIYTIAATIAMNHPHTSMSTLERYLESGISAVRNPPLTPPPGGYPEMHYG